MAHYDGLIRSTARLCSANSEEDFEDIVQILSIKVWKALRAFDPARCRTTRDRYVFMCVRDQAKDVCKKVKRHDAHIEDLTAADAWSGPSFEARYLRSDRDTVFGAVEDDENLLAELTELERSIVALLLDGYRHHAEMAAMLDVRPVDMQRAMKQIRGKLAWLRPNVVPLVQPTGPPERARRLGEAPSLSSESHDATPLHAQAIA